MSATSHIQDKQRKRKFPLDAKSHHAFSSRTCTGRRSSTSPSSTALLLLSGFCKSVHKGNLLKLVGFHSIMLFRWVIIVYIMLMSLKASVYPLLSVTTSQTPSFHSQQAKSIIEMTVKCGIMWDRSF